MTAIELTDITKQYSDVTALHEFSLTVQEGEIYGFLGPNGAGKSTTINILLDFARPTAGRAQVLGHDTQKESQRVRERVGAVPDGFSTYDRLTGRQHLEFAIESKDANDDPETLAERVSIANALDRKAGGYSKGMTQRLVLGMALVDEPDLLILDEPSTGLDPNGAREMRSIVREERSRGATVFFSSHILGQVESVCDRVGILREGELVAEDTVDGLRKATRSEASLHIEVNHLPNDALTRVRTISGVSEAVADGTSLRISCNDGSKSAVLTTLDEIGIEVKDFTTQNASLEDLFSSYTSNETVRPEESTSEVRA